MALTNLSQITTSGIATLTDINLNNITGVAATFTGNVTVGGTLTYDDVTNIDSVGLITARSGIIVSTGTATTALVVNGDARITGILTVGSSSLTLDGTNDIVNVGTALTLGHTQGLQFHTQSLHSQGFEVNNLNATGIVTATTFSIADKIVHTGDTNTAIRFPADDTFTVETAGSERLRITSDGKIGIGASAPAKTLEVKGDVRIYNATDTNSAILDITADSTGSNGVNLTSTYFGSGGFGPIRFTTSDTERLRITSDGYIKLSGRNVTGAANGNKLLRIYQPSRTDSEQDVLLLQSYNQETVNEIIIGGGDSSYNATTDISFRTAAINTTSGTERLRITSDGKVGIGLTNPGALLHLESTAANAARLRIGFDSPRYYDIYRGSTTNSGYLNFYGSQSTFVGYTFGGVDGEWMRIKSNGRVGIGTNNPSELLHLESGWTKQILKSTNLNTASSLIFDTHNINTADYLLGQLAGRWNGNDVAYINFEAGADTTNKDDGVITFLTSASGSSPTERVRITAAGHMTMGVPNYSFNNAKGFDTYLGMAFNQYDGGILMTSSSGLYAGEWSFGLEASASHTHFVILDDANERLRINSDGKVSIGAGLPSAGAGTFNVKPASATDSYFKLRPASEFDGAITGAAIDIRNSSNGASQHLVLRAQEFRFWCDGTDRIRITSDGLVGINAVPADSTQALLVQSNSTATSATHLKLRGGASGYTHSHISLNATSSANLGNTRGLGTFLYDEPSDVEWFAGRPYGQSDYYVIARDTGVTSPAAATAQHSNAVVVVDGSGRLTTTGEQRIRYNASGGSTSKITTAFGRQGTFSTCTVTITSHAFGSMAYDIKVGGYSAASAHRAGTYYINGQIYSSYISVNSIGGSTTVTGPTYVATQKTQWTFTQTNGLIHPICSVTAAFGGQGYINHGDISIVWS
jgi:hypothetical protein